MATSLLTAACLLVATGVLPGDVYHSNKHAIRVPIDINAAQKHLIKELQLYVSTDEGKTWNPVAVAAPTQDAFHYHAPGDGLYWLSLVIVDTQGRRNPADVTQLTPGIKVRVDTLKPVVQITSAERQGEYIRVRWEIQEEHPDVASLKLEYRPADALPSQWYAAPTNLSLTGSTEFRCATAATVRLQFKDQAGNVEIKTAEVPAMQAAPAPITAVSSAAPPTPPGSALGAGQSALGASLPTAPTTPTVNVWDAPATNSQPVRSAPRSEPTTPVTYSPHLYNPAPLSSAPAPYIPPPVSHTPMPMATETGARVLASSDNPSSAGSATYVSPGKSTPDLIPTKVIRSRSITLKYDVKNDGPAGIGAVELWLTTDDGKTWNRYVEDKSPSYRLGMKEPAITTDLPGEGTYGLRLVVLSKAGLFRSRPKPGDPPEIRVEVDLTKPQAQLYDTQPDQQDANTVILNWSASDRNPDAKPVSIQYRLPDASDWRLVADKLPLTGQYRWRLPPNFPSYVYLRLTVHDAAGNEQVIESKEPALVDLSRPEGHIVDVSLSRE